MKKFCLALTCITCLIPIHLLGAPQQLVNPKKATIGDIVLYTVIIDTPESGTIIPPSQSDFPDTITLKSVSIEKAPNPKKTRVKLSLVPFNTGKLSIPKHNLTIQDGPTRKVLKLLGFTLTIKSLLPPNETPSLKGMKSPLKVALNWTQLLIIIFALVLFSTIITIAIIRFLKRPKKAPRKKVIPAADAITAESTRKALAKLQNEQLIENGHIKQHYVRLTEIIKLYMSSGLDSPLMERTSKEILDFFRSKKLDTQAFKRIDYFFQQCDQAKFTKHTPMSDQNKQAMERALDIVTCIEKLTLGEQP